MISELTPPPPRWLPALLLLSSALAALFLSLLAGKSVGEAGAMIWSGTDLFYRCLSSGVVALVALSLALSTALGLEGLFGRRGRVALEFGGAVLALFPVAALTWGLVHEWIVRRGLPLETLMPLELPHGGSDAWMQTGRTLWKYFAPALVLAVPLLGAALMTTRLPARTRALALCLQAPVWLILIEDVLHFMGWGGWMAQSLRVSDVQATVGGLAACGVMMAVLTLFFSPLPKGDISAAPRFAWLSWLPWPLWVITASAGGFSQSTSWVLMWLVLFLMSWPARLAELHGVNVLRQANSVAAWSLEVVSTLVVWLAAVATLHPQPLAGGVMRFFRPLVVTTNAHAADTLRDPQAILRLGGLLLSVALTLHVLGRLLRWWGKRGVPFSLTTAE